MVLFDVTTIEVVDTGMAKHGILLARRNWGEFAARGGSKSRDYIFAGGKTTIQSLGMMATLMTGLTTMERNCPTNLDYKACLALYGNGATLGMERTVHHRKPIPNEFNQDCMWRRLV